MQFIGRVVQTKFHRSAVIENSIKDDLLEFKNLKSDKPNDSLLRLAILAAVEAFQLDERVNPLHLVDVFQQDLDIWSKSPGIPWKDEGYTTKNDIRKDPEAVRKVRLFWHRIKIGDELSPPDCLAFVGSHICPVEESKIRALWCYPATVTFGEAMFALPLIRKYQKHGPIAYGYETAIGGMKKIYDRFSAHTNFSGIVFEKFDKTVPPWLIDVVFMILLINVDITHYEEYGIPDARRLFRMWEYIVNYFKKTTIRTPNGLRFRKNVGIPGDSYFTQLVGSICNYILITWAYLDQFGHGPGDILVFGDNSLTGSNQCLNLFEAKKLFSSIGMSINMEKSQVTTELMTMKFCGYSVGCDVPRKTHHE